MYRYVYQRERSNKSKNPIPVTMTEKQLAELDGKVKMLYFKLNKSDEIIEKRDRQALDRHRTAITSVVADVESLKTRIEEKKFTKGESKDDITTWSQKIEEHLAKADEITRRVQNEIKAIDIEEEEKQTIEKHKLKMAFEREL